jgi:Glycosyl hydrolases family 16
MERKILTALLSALLTLSMQAEPPPGYTLAFDANFSVPNWLPISEWGPLAHPYVLTNWYDTTMIAHTPYDGDFGDAIFSRDGMRQSMGQLVLKAFKDETGVHHSGLVASIDPDGRGFSQALGFWEISCRLPAGTGVWPSFWLMDTVSLQRKERSVNECEIDVFEEFGYNPHAVEQHVHIWGPDGSSLPGGAKHISQLSGMTTGNHVYGCLINTDYIHFYFDGAEIWSTPTPREALHPMYVILDLALGGGYPVSIANPTEMWVQWIRCYAPPPP